VAAVVIIFGRERLTWRLQRYWSAYLAAADVMITAQLLAIATAGLDDPGNLAPIF
jgi:hypothetical protein